MHRILYFLFGLLLTTKGVCASSSDTQSPTSDPVPFDSIPNWIAKNVHFPEEAYNFGRCGVERFTISATWDGRVFISAPLNTLHPAFEQEIIRVVREAPRCVTECRRDNISKQVEIDFSKYLPSRQRRKMSVVAAYLPPRFKNHSVWDEGRRDFVRWIGSAYQIPPEWSGHAYADTMSVTYRIKPNGKVTEIVVSDCRDASIAAEIERTMTVAPLWKAPGIADEEKKINVVIRDTVVIGFDAEGNKSPVEICRNEVFRNSSLPPADPEMIVLMPETAPQYRGIGDFESAVAKALPVSNELLEIVGSFVIEKDGTVSGTEDDGVDDETAKTVLQFIRTSKWQPACQGGEPVRTLFAYSVLKSVTYPRAPRIALPRYLGEPTHRGANSSSFGKWFLDLHPKNSVNTPEPYNRDRQQRLEEGYINRQLQGNR